MSRQGLTQQMPPLFLSQRQHQQLERNFTEPYRRQIAELQNQVEFWQTTSEEQQEQIQGLEDQVAGLVAAGTWPDTADQITMNRYFTTNVILYFSFNQPTAVAVNIIRYFNIETGVGYLYLSVPAGTNSALVVWNYTTKEMTLYTDGQPSHQVTGDQPTVQYSGGMNVMAFY